MSRNSVFLSSGDRFLGVAFKFPPGSQASFRVEARNSALLLSCHGYLLEPTEWHKGSQAFCGVLRGDRGLLSRSCRKRRPHLGMSAESCVFSRAAARHVGFLSSYDGKLREPLVWPQGSPVSIRVARGTAALLSSPGRGIWPQDVLKGESRGLSRVAAGYPGFPRLVMVTSESSSCCLWEVRNTLDLGGASWDSTGVSEMEDGLIPS